MNTQPADPIDLAFEPLRQSSLRRCANQEEFDLVLKAYHFAREAHKNQRRISGDPIILHCISVAQIVVQEIGLGCKSIVTALLHHTLTDTEYSKEEIAALFGPKIADLVEGLGRMEKVFTQDKSQAETIREVILTMTDDARVLLIKLADRLHNIRHINQLPQAKQTRNLNECMYTLVPLAHRMGLYAIKSEMENIWMEHSEPEIYREIKDKVDAEMKRRGDDISKYFIQPIEQALRLEGFRFTVSTRIKQPYSIWNKIKKRNVPFEEVFDLYAIRIVFDPPTTNPEREQQECYHIEQLLNEMWTPNPNRRRDWIKTPKDTGYQALHSTFLTDKGNWVEVQIRSRRMDEIAEKGVAAHWRYKEGKLDKSGMEQWLAKMRSVLVDKDANALDFFDSNQTGALSKDIYVYTPTGEMKTLAKGSTALDFAFALHSELGKRALAAKINQKISLIGTVLRGGDLVEIISTATPKPKIEWLKYVTTNKARGMLMEALAPQLAQAIPLGKEMLANHLHPYGIRLQSRVLTKLMDEYKAGSRDELFARISIGDIPLSTIRQALYTGKDQKKVMVWVPIPDHKRRHDFSTTVPADCCEQFSAEPLVGLIDASRRLVLHDKKCPVITALKPDDNRLVAVTWRQQAVLYTLFRLSLHGRDRLGMVLDITRVIALYGKANMRKISIIAQDKLFNGEIEVYLEREDDLNNLILLLKNVKGVASVIQVTNDEQNEDNN